MRCVWASTGHYGKHMKDAKKKAIIAWNTRNNVQTINKKLLKTLKLADDMLIECIPYIKVTEKFCNNRTHILAVIGQAEDVKKGK